MSYKLFNPYLEGWTIEPSYWFSYNPNVYNPETHDLVPKKSYIESQITAKRKEIDTLKSQHEAHQRFYEESLNNLIKEMGELEKKIKELK